MAFVRAVRSAAASAAAPDPPVAGDVPVYELQSELKAARARIKALEGVVKTISRVAAPYAGNGTGR
jgi:hypothetical protein